MQQDASFGLIPMYQDGEQVQFLLIQHLAGHWSFPKGHAEGNESPLQSAQREFEEETGIRLYQVDEASHSQETYYPQKDGQILEKTVTYFPAWVSDKKVVIQAAEVQAYGWFEYREALDKITYPGAKKVLKAAKKYLEQQS